MRSSTFIIKAWNLFRGDEENIHGSYNALKTLEILHERVHAGRVWMHAEKHVTIASSGTVDHLIIPNSQSDVHLRSFTFDLSGGPSDIEFYESPFIDANSLGVVTTNEYANLNRNSVVERDFLAYEDPFIDVNSIGTMLPGAYVSASDKKSPGFSETLPIEMMLKNDGSSYLVRLRNTSGFTLDEAFCRITLYDAKDT